MNSPEVPTPAQEPAPVQAGGAASSLEVSGCWSNSGVYGDGTCLELQKFIHCRNCPVYSAAGTRLLDKPLPPNYRQEWTRHFAQERKTPDTGKTSAILFRIQNDWLALSTHCFQEVAERRPIHSLPHRRGGVLLGLVNVRGELVLCISVGHLLQIEPTPSPQSLRASYGRLLVIQSEINRLAFPVDEVQGPHRFHPQETTSPPAMAVRTTSRLVQSVFRWEANTVGWLDAENLFGSLDRVLA